MSEKVSGMSWTDGGAGGEMEGKLGQKSRFDAVFMPTCAMGKTEWSSGRLRAAVAQRQRGVNAAPPPTQQELCFQPSNHARWPGYTKF